jgi:hypothetical protein
MVEENTVENLASTVLLHQDSSKYGKRDQVFSQKEEKRSLKMIFIVFRRIISRDSDEIQDTLSQDHRKISRLFILSKHLDILHV